MYENINIRNNILYLYITSYSKISFKIYNKMIIYIGFIYNISKITYYNILFNEEFHKNSYLFLHNVGVQNHQIQFESCGNHMACSEVSLQEQFV